MDRMVCELSAEFLEVSFDCIAFIGNRSVCTTCGGATTAKWSCSTCFKARYCGAECQAKHWPTHKKTCSALVFSDRASKGSKRKQKRMGTVYFHAGTRTFYVALKNGKKLAL